MREDDLNDVGPPDIELQNGNQPEAVFSDEEGDAVIKTELKDPPSKSNINFYSDILLYLFMQKVRIY